MPFLGWLTGKPTKSTELVEAQRAFTPEELHAIDLHCKAYAHDPLARRGVSPGLRQHELLELIGLPWMDALLASQLFRIIASKTDGLVHANDIVLAKAKLERQGEQAASEFLFQLLDVHKDDAIHAEVLDVAVSTCIRMAVGSSSRGSSAVMAAQADASSAPTGTTTTSMPCSSDAQRCAAICNGALRMAAGDTSASTQIAKAMSFDDFQRWCKSCPAMQRTLSCLLLHVGQHGGGAVPSSPAHSISAPAELQGDPAGPAGGRTSLQLGVALPQLVQLGKLPAAALLLQPAWTWLLASCLPPGQRQEWRLLFSSQRDGKSFSTFFGRASAAPGPTLLLVRDRGGALFGGYAPLPWQKSGTFYGDLSSFIFSLEPTAQVYPATGINNNLQWCGVGFSQLPSGLGFGGAAGAQGQFALYLESTLDGGMSRPIATYGSPSLASTQLFQVATVECWLLAPPAEEREAADASVAGSNNGSRRGGSGSVLDKAKEDRAIMGFAGMNFHSDGLRDAPPEPIEG